MNFSVRTSFFALREFPNTPNKFQTSDSKTKQIFIFQKDDFPTTSLFDFMITNKTKPCNS
jgi:hypothetical protein